MDRKEQLMKIFSVHIREILTALPVHIGRLQEIRLRAGRPLMILYDNKEYLAGPEGNIVTESSEAYHVSAQEIQETMTYLSHYSIYAYEEEIRQGFLSHSRRTSGGHSRKSSVGWKWYQEYTSYYIFECPSGPMRSGDVPMN